MQPAPPRRFWPPTPERRAFLLALAAVLPLLVWWLGWFPGFVSSDSVDQLGQARRFEFINVHPAFHTLGIWLVTRVWDSPGAVSLVQVLATTGLLALAAGRLARLGVPVWLAAGTAWVVALLPAVGTTTIALWKDVPYSLALLWAFTEVLALAADPDGYWARRWSPIRMGLALALVWMFRHNGFLTVVPFLLVLAIWMRRRLAQLAPVAAVIAVVVIGANFVLYPLLDVDRTGIEPAGVFVSDVAASLRHEPGNFSDEEIAYLRTIAPLEFWRDAYDCHDSTPLVFGQAFTGSVITGDPARFRDLVVRTYLRDPDTVLGHRWCAANYLLWPPQPRDGYFHRPPFEIAANDLGIVRDPISDRAFQLTLDVFQWAEPDGRLWLTWRPALAVWLAIVAYAGVAWRRELRVLLLGAALLALQMANVAATTPAQEFRFAYGVYLVALLSAPLLWLVARPGDLPAADGEAAAPGHPLPAVSSPAAVGPG